MNSTFALARAAEAMLRALGGAAVTLRFPAAAPDDLTSRELGRAEPDVITLRLAPVVLRSASDKGAFELLASAAAVAALMAQRQADSAGALFASALGVEHGGVLLRILSVTPEYFAGTPYLYRIALSA
jgi:hypothetical protein